MWQNIFSQRISKFQKYFFYLIYSWYFQQIALDWIILDNWTLLSSKSVSVFLAKAFLILVFCFVVNNNFWGNSSYYIFFFVTLNPYLAPYIKYIGGGAGGFLWGPWDILGIYWWAMKYFSKILMGHEIFSMFYFHNFIF